jgi:hypothetical protein
MKRYFLLLVMWNCFVLLSFAQRDETSQESARDLYSKIDSIYPSYLTQHFPKIKNEDIEDIDLSYPGALKINKVFAVILFDNEHFKMIENETKSNAIRQYHFTDSCLRIIKYNPRLYENAPFILKKCHDTSGLLPIPDFESLAKSPLLPEIFKTATIYLLGAEKGVFLPYDKLEHKNACLYDDWEHGYSRGVVILGYNLILFWLDIW